MCTRTRAGSLNVNVMVVPESSLRPCRVWRVALIPVIPESALAEADGFREKVPAELTVTVRVLHTHRRYRKRGSFTVLFLFWAASFFQVNAVH